MADACPITSTLSKSARIADLPYSRPYKPLTLPEAAKVASDLTAVYEVLSGLLANEGGVYV